MKLFQMIKGRLKTDAADLLYCFRRLFIRGRFAGKAHATGCCG
ncbi:hypothetical protein [Neisseria sicca]|nr:hypothetical protein [Neisseria sicca]